MADDIILKVRLDGSKESLNNLNLLQEEITALADQKKKLTKAERDLQKEIEESGEATEVQTAALKDLAEQQVNNNLILKQTKQEFNETEKAVLLSAKTNRLAEGSVAQLAAQHTIDKDALRKLTEEEIKNTKAGQALNAKVKEQGDKLKELEKGYGVTSRSVGDYGIATESVLPIMGGFGQQIQGVVSQLKGVKEAITKFSVAQKGMAAGTKGTTSSLKAFRIALISTGIGAIVVAIGTLVAAFLSTQRGADALTRVIRPLQEIFQSLLGVIQNFSTNALDKIFKDPIGAVKELGKAILDNLWNRITGIVRLTQAAGIGIVAGFKVIGLGIKSALADVPLIGSFIDQEQLDKDLAEAKKAIVDSGKEIASSAIQVTLGLDEEQQDAALEFFDKAVQRGLELDDLQKQLEINAINLRRQVEKGNLEFNKQKEIAQNQLLTDEERLAAAVKAKAILEETTQIQIAQKNREIELAQLKTEANDTDREAQKEIAELLADRDSIEANAVQKRIELGNQANTIVKQRIALEKKAAIDAEKSEIAIINAKVERLKQERQLEEVLATETAEMKLQKELELQQKIGDLKIEAIKKQAALEAEVKFANVEDEAEQAVAKENFINEALTVARLDNQIAFVEKEKEIIDQQELSKQAKREETENLIASTAENSLAVAGQIAEKRKTVELEKLQEQLDSGLISQEDFEKKKNAIEKASFAKKKARDLAIIAIDLAKELSAIAAAAAGNPANALTFGGAGVSQAAILSGIAIAKSAVQAGIVATQTFASGGVIHGSSHANGGVNVRVGGSGMIEAEGGKAIINKRSTAKHLSLLSAINQDGGGIALAKPNTGTIAKFANGGIATSGAAQGQAIDMEALRSAFSESINTIKVQNVASETTGVANRVQQIEDSASF